MGQAWSSSVGSGGGAAAPAAPPPPSDDAAVQAERRRDAYGIAPLAAVQAAARDPTCHWVDVRSAAEVAHPRLGHVATDKRWVFAPCTDEACPVLEAAAESLIPDKAAAVIVYCSSGRRAAVARDTLQRKGYANVVNAGGLVDVFYPTKATK